MAMASLVLLAGAGPAQVREIPLSAASGRGPGQGDVRLRSGPEGIVPISGHPLLVQAAIAGMKALGSALGTHVRQKLSSTFLC